MGTLAQRGFWSDPIPISAALSGLSVALFLCCWCFPAGYGVSRWSVLLASSFGAVVTGVLLLAILPTLIVTWITGLVLSLPGIFIQRLQSDRLQNNQQGSAWRGTAITAKESVVVTQGKQLATDIIIPVSWTILAVLTVGSALLLGTTLAFSR